jgi:molecular chaperone DnaK
MLKHVADQFQSQHGVDLRANVVSRARLLRAVEAAKRQLSDHPFARIEEEFIAEKDGLPLHLNAELSRKEFEDLIQPWMDRTMDCVQRALTDAKLTARQIDKVVLVGGSTRSPIVSRLLEDRLGQTPHCEVNPDLVVAMGAAVQSALIAGTNVGAVLVDITPHSLGIRCLDFRAADGHFGMPFEFKFAPIIRRNTPLPANRSEVFTTVHDEQDTVDIEVFQGESSDVRQNHRVGNFKISGLAPIPAGNQITVQLDLNLDGILKVSAREKATGLLKQITIENALATITDESRIQARQRLDSLMGLPDGGFDDDDLSDEDVLDETADELLAESAMPELSPAPREGQRETVQARALLEKAERIREKASPEDQSELDKLMEKVRVTMTDRKWDSLSSACDELSDVLFYLEDS